MISIVDKLLRKWLERIKLNNEGTALISVVAVAIFLSVIATTIIYISGKNYQIKANDYQNKNTFYQAEMALDEFKAALADDVSEAFKFAYREFMTDYANQPSGDKLNELYQQRYFDYLYYKWTKEVKYGTDIPDDVESYVTVKGESIYTTVETFIAKSGHELKHFKEYFIKEDKLAVGDEKMELGCIDTPDKRGRFILKNIRVSYTNKGYSSYICTDIAMDPPAYYMGVSNIAESEGEGTPGGGGTPAIPKDTTDRLYMGEYILYMNWHKY